MKPNDQPPSISNPEPCANSKTVYICTWKTLCAQCGDKIEIWDKMLIDVGNAHICLDCAGLGKLEFLPSGNAALTRRAKKHSSIWALVMKFSKCRKRNERQGVLVEPAAIEKAEAECLADNEARSRSRERAALRRDAMEGAYLGRFSARIREIYPCCPEDECDQIAIHACEKHSGRVGRSAEAKSLDDGAIRLAVRAHIRHEHTRYDELLNLDRYDRESARSKVAVRIDEIESKWSREKG